MPKRPIPAALAIALLALATPAQAAETTWSERLADALERAKDQGEALAEKAEQAIVVGGVLVYRHRHAIAGATLGCLAGATVGAGAALGAGVATGGATIAGAGPAAALGCGLGCGLGALGGAAMGHQLDGIYDLQ
jgi:hypothetical protein